MINYHYLVNETFEFSKFISKNKKLLILWYEYKKGGQYGDFEIKFPQLYNLSQDEAIIRNDFILIQDKIKRGEAHLLSEGDTSFLGACTKSKDSSIRTTQPHSLQMAKPRAFCLKKSFLKGIVSNHVTGVPVLQNANDLKTVEEYVMHKLQPYIGKTQREIWNQVGGNPFVGDVPKQFGKMISDKIIGRDEELKEKHNLFTKTTFLIKNLPVDDKDFPLERLTFRPVVISEFSTPWKNSDWKNYFEEISLILVCYEGKGKKNGERTLKGIKQLTFTGDDLDKFKLSYNMIRTAISEQSIDRLPYPSKFKNPSLVIAPKGNRGDDAYNTFFTKNHTKTCFMMEKRFIYDKYNEKNGLGQVATKPYKKYHSNEKHLER